MVFNKKAKRLKKEKLMLVGTRAVMPLTVWLSSPIPRGLSSTKVHKFGHVSNFSLKTSWRWMNGKKPLELEELDLALLLIRPLIFSCLRSCLPTQQESASFCKSILVEYLQVYTCRITNDKWDAVLSQKLLLWSTSSYLELSPLQVDTSLFSQSLC